MTSHPAIAPASAATFAPAPSGEPRFAIYYTTPADHPLTRAAEAWLGRSAFERKSQPASSIAGSSRGQGNNRNTLVGEPRRYGFHATLKAPFRLADGVTVEELERALSKFANSTRPCPLGPLHVGMLGGFLALVPVQPMLRVRSLCADVVEAFDSFRAPFNTAELKRRRIECLDDGEAEHLVRWGYPYVFDRFRFHMTLTNRIQPEERSRVEAELELRLGHLLDEDFAIDAVTLFDQESPDADFVVRRRFPLNPEALL
ncbi:DUF1045 domain-containing protein [Rhizobium miluonense]|uniref:Putative phosphonate metabolism protein n=1 Tax=Rhizobium miluonense TaxID=411945 RepID=A0A1C3WZP1_9HYPH|nr:DUF1045 domain-containing protein [Rhizobium miluonense]SCB45453.1 putative phosphonate metabolism protein [Rhizobium miluonense]